MQDNPKPDDSERMRSWEKRVSDLEDYIARNSNRQADPAAPTETASGVIVHLSPWFWTLVMGVLGIVLLIVWLLTFSKEGGVNLSPWLFPAADWLLRRVYAQGDVNIPVWYGSLLLHWPLVGALIDLLRWSARARRASTSR